MASEQQSDDVRNEESTAWLEGVHDLIAALQDTAVSEVEIRFGEYGSVSAPPTGRRSPGAGARFPCTQRGTGTAHRD